MNDELQQKANDLVNQLIGKDGQAGLTEDKAYLQLGHDDETDEGPEEAAMRLARQYQVRVTMHDRSPNHTGGWPIFCFYGSPDAIARFKAEVGEENFSNE